MTPMARAMRRKLIGTRVKVLRARRMKSEAAKRRWEERRRELGLDEDEEGSSGRDVLLDGLPDSI